MDVLWSYVHNIAADPKTFLLYQLDNTNIVRKLLFFTDGCVDWISNNDEGVYDAHPADFNPLEF